MIGKRIERCGDSSPPHRSDVPHTISPICYGLGVDPLHDLSLDTVLQHLGEERHPFGAIAPPIVQASNFRFETVEEYRRTQNNWRGGEPYVYSRVTNPTVELAEKKIAALEGAERCRLLGSGQGAITAAILSNLASGAHIVSVDTCYGPAHDLIDQYLPRFGVTATYVSGLDADEMLDAIKPETKLVYLESPSTFVFRLQDLRKIAKGAKEKGVVTMIDNTYSTPLYQNPLEFGIDYVLHSCSKYLGGHSDLCAGAICSTEERLETILKFEINLFGSALAPFPAWLLTRGMRSLRARIKMHEESANQVAAWLESRPEVDRVHHVSLPSFPQRDLYHSQMRGSTGLLSFEPKVQDESALIRFVEALKVFTMAVSWGGYESLVVLLSYRPIGYAEPRWIVRLSIGLEAPRDLIADLEQALSSL